MNRKIFQIYGQICSAWDIRGSVLEIGAIPTDHTLLNMACLGHVSEKIGLNLKPPCDHNDFRIVQGNANHMDYYPDEKFDLVLCSSVLEHDKYFWKTLAEIRRVTRRGGRAVIGNPGFKKYPWERRFIRHIVKRIPGFGLLSNATPVVRVHNSPGDYYRFSEQAFREVIFEGFTDVEVKAFKIPPFIIGYGTRL